MNKTNTEHQVQQLETCLIQATKPGSRWSRKRAPLHLVQPASIKTLMIATIYDWSWIVFLVLVMCNTPDSWYPLWAVLIGGRLHALGVILHDAAHMPLRGKSWSTRLLEILTGYPVGSTLNAMRYHHIRHHRDSGLATDPYFTRGLDGRPWMYSLVWLRHFLLVPFWVLRGYYGSLASFIPSLRNSYARIFLLDCSGKNVGDSLEVVTCAREERYQALFFLGIFYLTWLWPVFLFTAYWLPLVLAGLFAGYRLLMEHKYINTPDRSIESIVATTHDHSLGPLSRIFLAPHNVGFHLLHHIHPQAGMDYLPVLRNWYIKTYSGQYPRALGGRLAHL